MKTYIVIVKGIEKGYIKAANHNAAKKKSRILIDHLNQYKSLIP